jgi:hypothetical protein
MIDWDAYWSHDARYRQPAMLHSELQGLLLGLATPAKQRGGNTPQPVVGSRGSSAIQPWLVSTSSSSRINQKNTAAWPSIRQQLQHGQNILCQHRITLTHEQKQQAPAAG